MAAISSRNVSTVIASLVIVIALSCSGCGGGSDDGTSTAAAPVGWSKEKTAFVKKADEICKRGREEGLRQMVVYLKAHDDSEVSKRMLVTEASHTVFLPEVQKQINEIRTLDPPPGDRQTIEAILVAMEEAIVTGRRKTASGHPLGASFHHSSELARHYGLIECVYG